ncbi:hypothetical protein GWO43_26880 [candidate division KSB1 bacterium]|nr:hypothetical protein [candidate division KSB1 bacterium]NIR70183.1 hypothetical protein [candidate division KSB1 bacterium]NIS27570.1 hypothetical protein [candidate division KSB1 bacterium]NIT74422.1 hypothetical protein [candidate division KSB1 bacterium]NIU28287.1 hypothetical protein [candidate division KSB1 bacterium]
MRFALVLLLFFNLIPCDNANPQSKSLTSLKVKLEISADQSIKNIVSSYITRELRSIPDVTIVESDYLRTISIIATEMEYQSGENSAGVAIAVVVLQPIDNSSFDPKLREGLEPVIFRDFRLYTGSSEDLKRICQTIIADFDRETLEPIRIVFQEYGRFFK